MLHDVASFGLKLRKRHVFKYVKIKTKFLGCDNV
jgi:hypothetical protein